MPDYLLALMLLSQLGHQGPVCDASTRETCDETEVRETIRNAPAAGAISIANGSYRWRFSDVARELEAVEALADKRHCETD